jgi:peptidyl-prolyl cis-trans isomerase C
MEPGLAGIIFLDKGATMHQLQKKLGFVILGVALMTLSAFAEDKMLAKVGNFPVYASELNKRLESLPPQYRSIYASPEGKAKLLQQIVDERLIYIAATQKGIEKRKEVLDEFEIAKKNIVISSYVSDLFKGVQISDAEIKDFYDKNQQEFSTKPQVHARHILLKTEQEALDVKAKLDAGEPFEALAKTFSQDPSAAQNGGDLGFFSKGDMVPEFELAAFTAALKTVTAPVKTQFGYHLIEVLERKEGTVQALDDTIKGQIKEFLTRQKQKDVLTSVTDKLKASVKVEQFPKNL